MGMEDSVKGIYKAVSDCAEISACAGGIGISLSKIRSKNSYIRGTNGISNGIVPLCRVLNETARHINQSGKRPGSIAVYIEPHNPEILDFLELRKNTGAESERARDIFLALWISDLFMKRVEADAEWSLFDSDECQGLDQAYGDAFEQLYNKYESEGKARKTLPARKIWNYIITSQIETGVPYICFKDAVNKKSNQSNIGTICNSNLCAEVLIYSDHKEYAVCTLASLSLPNFVSDDGKVFNFEKLIEVTEIVIRNLNKIIDVTYYPVPETEISNKKSRPLGLGVQGLNDTYAKMGLSFESNEARALNKLIFESMYYSAMKTSHQLALETEPYSRFDGSPLSEGKFQFDLWGVTPSDRYDWESLRKDVMKDGVANSLLIALMPTASTSQILGNNECFEPITSNMYTRRTMAGDFIVINKYLVKDLMKLGLWNVDMKNNIISHSGSIQKIDTIPENIRSLYKTVWEIKQKVLIDQAIDRGPYVCQTQSMNLFFEEPTQGALTSALFHGWKNGLKTGSYYIRSKPKAQAQQFTIDPSKVALQKTGDNYEPCEMCSA
jgi:ribonucleoside-diphosphate reductase alpha chain